MVPCCKWLSTGLVVLLLLPEIGDADLTRLGLPTWPVRKPAASPARWLPAGPPGLFGAGHSGSGAGLVGDGGWYSR